MVLLQVLIIINDTKLLITNYDLKAPIWRDEVDKWLIIFIYIYSPFYHFFMFKIWSSLHIWSPIITNPK